MQSEFRLNWLLAVLEALLREIESGGGVPVVNEGGSEFRLWKSYEVPSPVCRPKNLPVVVELHLSRLCQCSSVAVEGIPILFMEFSVERLSR